MEIKYFYKIVSGNILYELVNDQWKEIKKIEKEEELKRLKNSKEIKLLDLR